MVFAHFAEAHGGGFGSEVPLRGGEEFVADHEFANGGRTEQWRKIVRVEMPGCVRLAVGRALVKTHGIRKSRFK
jgi:hypothetical protein